MRALKRSARAATATLVGLVIIGCGLAGVFGVVSIIVSLSGRLWLLALGALTLWIAYMTGSEVLDEFRRRSPRQGPQI